MKVQGFDDGRGKRVQRKPDENKILQLPRQDAAGGERKKGKRKDEQWDEQWKEEPEAEESEPEWGEAGGAEPEPDGIGPDGTAPETDAMRADSYDEGELEEFELEEETQEETDAWQEAYIRREENRRIAAKRRTEKRRQREERQLNVIGQPAYSTKQASDREKAERKTERKTEQKREQKTGQKTSGRNASARKSGKSRGPVILAVLGCIALFLLLVYIALAAKLKREEEDAIEAGNAKQSYTQEEVDALLAEAAEAAKAEEAERILGGIQQNLEDGMAAAKALRAFYPNDIVVATSGRIRFFPVQDNLKKNSYQQDNLVQLDNGELQYVENGQVISHKGIDVSYHQGEINWELVAQDGVEFAFLRVGLRGYGTGKVVVDEQFENNIKGALANGIQVGVYFYSQSVNEEEVLEEAQLVLDQIAPYRVTGPVVYDAEKVASSRTSNLTVEERTAMTLTFCRTVEAAGYRPMIYLNLDTAFSTVDLAQLEEYDKWFAHYGTDMYYPYDYKIWQYSESGSVQGIASEVDMNISFGDVFAAP